MPAKRSRTERWRDCLRQVHEREGALEISLPPGEDDGRPRGPNLVWRVRVGDVTADAIFVEPPSAMGQTISLESDLELIAVLAIGQNRWMFRTRTQGCRIGHGRFPRLLRLQMPETVERCRRRDFFRMSTATLRLPRVECWPLLDPASVGPAEVANREQVLSMSGEGQGGEAWPGAEEPLMLPEVGPRFHATLMNIGGGGAGLMIDRVDSAAMDRCRFFWMRINLRPQVPVPIAVTARLAHTHIDSQQNLYAGMAFDFAFNPPHRQFIVDQLCRYVARLQWEAAKLKMIA